MPDVSPKIKLDNHESLLKAVAALGGDGVTIDNLCELIGRDRSTVYRLIKILEEKYKVVIGRNVYDELILIDAGVFNIERLIKGANYLQTYR